MKSKRILRFYFKVDDLERALNNLILRYACKSKDVIFGGEACAGRILELIRKKGELSRLWRYLDGVMSSLDEGDVRTLANYSVMRGGIQRLDERNRKEIKRALIKFTRHARNIDRFLEGMQIVGEFYCLI